MTGICFIKNMHIIRLYGLYIIVGKGRLIWYHEHEQRVVFLIHTYRSKKAFLINVFLITFEHLICCMPLVFLKISIQKVETITSVTNFKLWDFQRNIMMHGIFPLTEDEITSEFRYEGVQRMIQFIILTFSFKDKPSPWTGYDICRDSYPMPSDCLGIPIF